MVSTQPDENLVVSFVCLIFRFFSFIISYLVIDSVRCSFICHFILTFLTVSTSYPFILVFIHTKVAISLFFITIFIVALLIWET
jgi:hypothetical protein